MLGPGDLHRSETFDTGIPVRLWVCRPLEFRSSPDGARASGHRRQQVRGRHRAREPRRRRIACDGRAAGRPVAAGPVPSCGVLRGGRSLLRTPSSLRRVLPEVTVKAGARCRYPVMRLFRLLRAGPLRRNALPARPLRRLRGRRGESAAGGEAVSPGLRVRRRGLSRQCWPWTDRPAPTVRTRGPDRWRRMQQRCVSKTYASLPVLCHANGGWAPGTAVLART